MSGKIEAAAQVDPIAWFELAMRTPFGAPQGCRTPEEAARVPGCAVKSRDREGPLGFPKWTGILVLRDEDADRVIVRGWGDAVSPEFVWEGTVRDYLALWECD